VFFYQYLVLFNKILTICGKRLALTNKCCYNVDGGYRNRISVALVLKDFSFTYGTKGITQSGDAFCYNQDAENRPTLFGQYH